MSKIGLSQALSKPRKQWKRNADHNAHKRERRISRRLHNYFLKMAKTDQKPWFATFSVNITVCLNAYWVCSQIV